jgi:hypothetical protein
MGGKLSWDEHIPDKSVLFGKLGFPITKESAELGIRASPVIFRTEPWPATISSRS